MNRYEKSLINVRNRFMKERKILCTGNPSDPKNIAHGVKKIFKNVFKSFISGDIIHVDFYSWLYAPSNNLFGCRDFFCL